MLRNLVRTRMYCWILGSCEYHLGFWICINPRWVLYSNWILQRRRAIRSNSWEGGFQRVRCEKGGEINIRSSELLSQLEHSPQVKPILLLLLFKGFKAWKRPLRDKRRRFKYKTDRLWHIALIQPKQQNASIIRNTLLHCTRSD